ncbi:MAG TPA: glycosyl hydrolase, partial [bacterium]|nr:glycosyl hydrolase [bacterium]
MEPGLYKSMEWRQIGPFRGGRSVAVAGDVRDPLTFYFGATGGGVWKTTDGGITWLNVSDGFFKTSAVGALSVAESDPNVIYAGMGETCIRGNITPGDGIYKSLDAGKTWSHTGLKETQFIGGIAIHPQNPDFVLVAAMGHIFGTNKERGIYKTTDGGKTWKQTLYKDDKTGAVEVAFDPRNPRIVYAALWEAHRNAWSMTSG